jgi:hypothetical protein
VNEVTGRGLSLRAVHVKQGFLVRRSLVLALMASLIAAIPTPARAACAFDPSDLSFRQMIKRGITGETFYHRMIIGRVVLVRDPGDEGGRATAVVAVGAHPTGFVPLVARARFYKPPPNVGLEDNVEFAPGERWVIMAHHRRDGSYSHDGGCGQTQRVGRELFRRLMSLARAHD